MLIFLPVPGALISTRQRDKKVIPAQTSYNVWVHYRRGTLSISWIFYNSQQVARCLTFDLDTDTICVILNSKWICPFLKREILFLSSKTVSYTNIFERTVHNKDGQRPTHMTYRNVEDAQKIISQHGMVFQYFSLARPCLNFH